jgi:hypothetical protein
LEGRKVITFTETRSGLKIASIFISDEPLVHNGQAIRESYSENTSRVH